MNSQNKRIIYICEKDGRISIKQCFSDTSFSEAANAKRFLLDDLGEKDELTNCYFVDSVGSSAKGTQITREVMKSAKFAYELNHPDGASGTDTGAWSYVKGSEHPVLAFQGKQPVHKITITGTAGYADLPSELYSDADGKVTLPEISELSGTEYSWFAGTTKVTNDTVFTEDCTIAPQVRQTVTLKSGTGYTLAAKQGFLSPVEYGQSFSFSLAKDEAYSNSAAVVRVNGEILAPTSENEYTISHVTSATEVTVEGIVKNTYAVNLEEGEGYTFAVSPDFLNPVEYGMNFSFTLTKDAAYSDSTAVVKVNGDVLAPTSGNEYTISNITQTKNVTVEGITTKNMYAVNLETGDGYTLAVMSGFESPVEYGKNFSFTLTKDAAYSNSTAVVKVNGEVLNPTSGNEYAISNITKVMNVTVEGITTKNTYAVSLGSGTGYTLAAKTGSGSPVEHGKDFTFTLELDADYTESVPVVKVNGTEISLSANNEYTITNITGPQTVTVTGVTKNIDKNLLKKTIQTQIKEALAINESKYTTASVFGYQILSAVKTAKTAVETEDLSGYSIEQLQECLVNLKEAQKNLVETESLVTFTLDASMVTAVSGGAVTVLKGEVKPISGGAFVSAGQVTAATGSAFRAAAGDTVRLTAEEIEGYNFTGWFKNGAETPVSTEKEYVFTFEGGTELYLAKYTVKAGGDPNPGENPGGETQETDSFYFTPSAYTSYALSGFKVKQSGKTLLISVILPKIDKANTGKNGFDVLLYGELMSRKVTGIKKGDINLLEINITDENGTPELCDDNFKLSKGLLELAVQYGVDLKITLRDSKQNIKGRLTVPYEQAEKLAKQGISLEVRANAQEIADLQSSKEKKLILSVLKENGISSEKAQILSLTNKESNLEGATLLLPCKDGKAGTVRYVYSYNPLTNQLEEIPNAKKKLNKDGSIGIQMAPGVDYLVVEKELTGESVKKLTDNIKVGLSFDQSHVTVVTGNRIATVNKFTKNKDSFRMEEAIVTYQSGNKSIVTVSKAGKITLKKKGKTTITTTIKLENGETKIIKSEIYVK